jgi:hypothetical protein
MVKAPSASKPHASLYIKSTISNITISCTNIPAGQFSVSLADLSGKKIWNSQVISLRAQQSYTLSPGSIKPGLYVVTVEYTGGRLTNRVMINRIPDR